ncbi:MAG TPA: triple tyrosine motif-containing protein, partial [Flavitalea sp.]|nr:triple tyrosine motif-containing protein [Flavitalea sp.]
NIYQVIEYEPGKIITNDFVTIDFNKEPAVIDTSFKNLTGSKAIFEGKYRQSFTKDTSGNLWFGENRTLARFKPGNKAILRLVIPFPDMTAFPFPVYGDKKDNIWMGYKKFVVRYNITSGKYFRYEYPTPQHSYDYDFLQCIFDDDGLIWLGSMNGLFCLDTETGKMKEPFLFRQSEGSSISNNHVLSFCQDVSDPSRYLWVGTKGGGLNRLDKSTGEFKRYTTKDGLPNNVIYGIETDYAGNLWLSTNKGIAEFNVHTGLVRKFDVNDGLQGNEFNRYASTRTTPGLLVFGGLNGINYFNPGALLPLKSPTVMLTELRLFNRPVKTGSPASALRNDIGFTETLELLHEQNVITLRFAAMDYRRHNSIKYRYKMEGFDEDWIYSGTSNEATYTNLDAGKYSFLVQASFEENNWYGQPKKLNIHIMAPWWNTWWFKLLLIMGTIAVAYGLYRYRIHQLTRLDSLRNRIARDLHDEVGSSISTIAIYSKILHDQMENKTFNNEPLLEKITDHATEIMESMNDIIWNINTKNDAFENIINRMREHAFQLLEAKGYSLHFDFDETIYQMQLPMEKRRDFYLIYKEALNNVAKYAEGTNVWINLSIHSSGISLIIRDDGKGFDHIPIKKGGNGLKNMQHRARLLNGKISITSEGGTGTTVHLEF